MNFSWLNREKLFGMAMMAVMLPVLQQSAPWLVNGVLDGAKERVTFPMIEQRINVVRAAAAQMKCPASVTDAPIVAAIMEINQRIAHEQESNRVHWTLLDILSTDEWNRIAFIDLPCSGRNNLCAQCL